MVHTEACYNLLNNITGHIDLKKVHVRKNC